MAHESASADGYTISDDLTRFDLDRAYGWISRESYGGIAELFLKSLANSLAVGVYAPSGEMAAMARVVTDRATFGWITDVFVDMGHRGEGLGKLLMAYLKAHPDLQRLRRLHLATRDAHGLYAQFRLARSPKINLWIVLRDLSPMLNRPNSTVSSGQRRPRLAAMRSKFLVGRSGLGRRRMAKRSSRPNGRDDGQGVLRRQAHADREQRADEPLERFGAAAQRRVGLAEPGPRTRGARGPGCAPRPGRCNGGAKAAATRRMTASSAS